MKTTSTLAGNQGCSIFDIFNQDIFDVIMLINFYIQLGSTASANGAGNTRAGREQRVRVNDSTASGGWY